MAFVNNYAPEPSIADSDLYGPELYDVNSELPVPPALSTNKLRLVPFIPRVHAATYFNGIRGHCKPVVSHSDEQIVNDVYRGRSGEREMGANKTGMRAGSMPSVWHAYSHESMFKYISLPIEHPLNHLRLVEMVRRDSSCILFAAIDTTRPDSNHLEWQGSLAGLFGIINTRKKQLVAEIGPAIVLPAFQRTHVASHAVGLLLKYILELPPFGLGFGRVEWSTLPLNAPSNNLAKQMGFKREGMTRWKYVMSAVEGYQKTGNKAREGDAGNGLLGGDRDEYTLCWDDWEKMQERLWNVPLRGSIVQV